MLADPATCPMKSFGCSPQCCTPMHNRPGRSVEFLKVVILGSRILDILLEKSGHFRKMNNSFVNKQKLCNMLENSNLFLSSKGPN